MDVQQKVTVKIGGVATKSYTQTFRNAVPPAAMRFGDRSFTQGQIETANRIGDDLMAAAAKGQNYEAVKKEARVLARKMEKAGNDEAARLFIFVSRFFFGLSTPTSGGHTGHRPLATGLEISANNLWSSSQTSARLDRPKGLPLSGSIRWKSLSQKWMAKKGNQTFFKDTGALKAFVRNGMADIPVRRLGGVKVTLDEGKLPKSHAVSSRTFLIAAIKAEIFPRANPAYFPGLATGDWSTTSPTARLERALSFWGVPQDVRDKLSGPQNRYRGGRRVGYPWHRPMITPAVQFWAMYRIPGAIARTVKNASLRREARIYD